MVSLSNSESSCFSNVLLNLFFMLLAWSFIFKMSITKEPDVGFEPTTCGLQNRCNYRCANPATCVCWANLSNRPDRRIFGQTANYLEDVFGQVSIGKAQLVADPRMLCDDIVHSVNNMITCPDPQLAITIQ